MLLGETSSPRLGTIAPQLILTAPCRLYMRSARNMHKS